MSVTPGSCNTKYKVLILVGQSPRISVYHTRVLVSPFDAHVLACKCMAHVPDLTILARTNEF